MRQLASRHHTVVIPPGLDTDSSLSPGPLEYPLSSPIRPPVSFFYASRTSESGMYGSDNSSSDTIPEVNCTECQTDLPVIPLIKPGAHKREMPPELRSLKLEDTVNDLDLNSDFKITSRPHSVYGTPAKRQLSTKRASATFSYSEITTFTNFDNRQTVSEKECSLVAPSTSFQTSVKDPIESPMLVDEVSLSVLPQGSPISTEGQSGLSLESIEEPVLFSRRAKRSYTGTCDFRDSKKVKRTDQRRPATSMDTTLIHHSPFNTDEEILVPTILDKLDGGSPKVTTASDIAGPEESLIDENSSGDVVLVSTESPLSESRLGTEETTGVTNVETGNKQETVLSSIHDSIHPIKDDELPALTISGQHDTNDEKAPAPTISGEHDTKDKEVPALTISGERPEGEVQPVETRKPEVLPCAIDGNGQSIATAEITENTFEKGQSNEGDVTTVHTDPEPGIQQVEDLGALENSGRGICEQADQQTATMELDVPVIAVSADTKIHKATKRRGHGGPILRVGLSKLARVKPLHNYLRKRDE